jgi:hypothetical protein
MSAMMIRDLGDSRSGLNRAVESAEEAVEVLESGGERRPFFCLLESPEYELMIGVGPGFGCVQHSLCDRRPPYLMAVASEPAVTTEFGEFLSGNEASEVPRRYCLAWPEVRTIVSFFVRNGGQRDPAAHWEALGPTPRT